MSDYQIKLEVFEGPLELLLHLLAKNKVDIYDIPIAEITEQYMAYLQTLQQFNIEVASEFLVMAATLLQIKSRMLLPKPPAEISCEEDNEGDPRQQLVERLLAYQQFKEAALVLEQLYLKRQRHYARPPQVFAKKMPLPQGLQVDDLLAAFSAVYERMATEYAMVAREEISVQEKIYDILLLLQNNKSGLRFEQVVFRSHSRAEVIAAFLAVLELTRLRRIRIEQRQLYGPIYLWLKE